MIIINQSVEILDDLDTERIMKKLEVAGRTCYQSDPRYADQFLRGIIKSGHESVLEHQSITVRLVTDRATANQIVRHRIASYCLSGDTVVYTDKMNRGVRKRTVKELFDMKKQYRDMTFIRSVDEDNLVLVSNKVKDVVYSGEKEVFEVKTENGYTIKATLEHRFFTENGWKKLKDIKLKDKIYVNGSPIYQNKEWLENKYKKENLSQKEISDLCGVSKHTIRSWVRKFNIQKELGEWSVGVEPPNKGKTKHDYEPMRVVSEKMKNNENFERKYGKDNPAYKEEITKGGGYSRANRQFKRSFICQLCNKESEYTEIHHKDRNPKNNKESNLEELCVTCHKVRHQGSVVKTIILDTVNSIKSVGMEGTYDICMEAPHHNFIANGFVVHNSQESQRYCNYTKERFDGEVKFVYPIDSSLEHRNLLSDAYLQMEHSYNRLIKHGATPEQARFALGNGAATTLIVTMNIRAWRHFFKLRTALDAQTDVRYLADSLLGDFKEYLPVLFEDIEVSDAT